MLYGSMKVAPDIERQKAAEHIERCECDLCRFHNPVEVPAHLLQAIKSGDVVVFAGAGVSTERKSVDGPSFYRQVAYDLGISTEQGPDFPSLMQSLVEQPDGRLRLIRKIRGHFDHIEFFPKLLREATEFHQELSTLFSIQDIITTNWDLYFERFCHATPFVTSQDATYWEAAQRRVLKIHGSIDNFSTIVASTADYREAHDRLSRDLIGSRLKVLLSTKNILFAGYSLTDSDFQQVYEFVQEQIGPFAKQAYAITVDTSEDTAHRLSALNIQPIYCDAAHFLRLVKNELIGWKCWLSDEAYENVSDMWWKVQSTWSRLHDEIDIRVHPIAVMSLSYLDGVKHGLELIEEKKRTGEYSHRCVVIEKLRAYERLISEKRKAKMYADTAYLEGFLNAIIFWLSLGEEDIEEPDFPLFFFFGRGEAIESVEQFLEELPTFNVRHKGASIEAIRLAKSLPEHGDKLHWYHKCQI